MADTGTYHLSLSGDEDANATGDLDIHVEDLTIAGEGPSTVISCWNSLCIEFDSAKVAFARSRGRNGVSELVYNGTDGTDGKAGGGCHWLLQRTNAERPGMPGLR